MSPQHTAIIYELEPRTYFATDTGESHAGQLSALSSDRLARIRDLGADYVWLAGVVEHATPRLVDPSIVKGQAGSYYAIYDAWDVSRQVGGMGAFEKAVARIHEQGLRLLIDLVPNHTARVHKTDIPGKSGLNFGSMDRTDIKFSLDNNYYYLGQGSVFAPPVKLLEDTFRSFLESPAKVTGNNILSPAPAIGDWYETVKLNYGYDLFSGRLGITSRPRTWDQVVDVATYWLQKGVDGFRVDFAHAVPIEFWRYFISEVRKVKPDAFLVAEAYEGDPMIMPGLSYEAMFSAGFDSIFNSEMYWNIRRQAQKSQDLAQSTYSKTPAMREAILREGYAFTQMMGNHDEVRVASSHFSPCLSDRPRRADLGYAYATFAALLPGHYLVHAGDEVEEAAEVFGPFAGDNGRTSIFDFVYQAQSRAWLTGNPPDFTTQRWALYRKMLKLKRSSPFNLAHSYNRPTFIELTPANFQDVESKWVSAYIRFSGEDRYLVVVNADPEQGHGTTVHFTTRDNADTLGVLKALHISNSDRRYVFTDVLVHEGWVPADPAISGRGVPGWALYKSGGIPSGLYLGTIPARTTYVFRVGE